MAGDFFCTLTCYLRANFHISEQIFSQNICIYQKKPYLCIVFEKRPKVGSVAQLVEQQTLNLWVVGSTPTRFTKQGESLGEMSEWSNEPVLKTGVLVRVPGVRIPLSPQKVNETYQL